MLIDNDTKKIYSYLFLTIMFFLLVIFSSTSYAKNTKQTIKALYIPLADHYAAFEQSLPWADVVETNGFGKVAWYSKDVMPRDNGHVECITLATDKAIKNKTKAINEVMYYIRKAGNDIELARKAGGKKLENIVKIVRKHIKEHSRKAIIASLDHSLRVINCQKLDIDKAGLKQIMDLAVEAGILKKPVDVDAFADNQFANYLH